MKEFLNKNVTIVRIFEGKKLFYTATVTGVNETHITIIDKYGRRFYFPQSEIQEMQEERT